MGPAAHQAVAAVGGAHGEVAGQAPQAMPLPGLAAEPRAIDRGQIGPRRRGWWPGCAGWTVELAEWLMHHSSMNFFEAVAGWNRLSEFGEAYVASLKSGQSRNLEERWQAQQKMASLALAVNR